MTRAIKAVALIITAPLWLVVFFVAMIGAIISFAWEADR